MFSCFCINSKSYFFIRRFYYESSYPFSPRIYHQLPRQAHNGASVYAPTFIEDCEPAVKKLQEEYGFEYTVEYVK